MVSSAVGGASLMFSRFATDPRAVFMETTVEIIELFTVLGFSRFSLLSMKTASRTGKQGSWCRIQIGSQSTTEDGNSDKR